MEVAVIEKSALAWSVTPTPSGYLDDSTHLQDESHDYSHNHNVPRNTLISHRHTKDRKAAQMAQRAILPAPKPVATSRDVRHTTISASFSFTIPETWRPKGGIVRWINDLPGPRARDEPLQPSSLVRGEKHDIVSFFFSFTCSLLSAFPLCIATAGFWGMGECSCADG